MSTPTSAPSPARRVASLVFPGAELLDVTGPLEVFVAAERVLSGRAGRAVSAYQIEVVGPSREAVRLAGGLRVLPDRTWRRPLDGFDTLLVPGRAAIDPRAERQLLRWLRAMDGRVRRIASVCTGAILLAEAGLLAGRRATTHWESCQRLAEYPDVDVEPDTLFVRDGSVSTSAGIAAGIDLALDLLEEDHGRAVAMATARELVVYFKRPGGQSQFSAPLQAQTRASGGELDGVLGWVLENLDGDLSVERLAERACVSPRHFARVFRRSTGTTPARFVEQARVERARQQLDEGAASLQDVAAACGFGSVERMRRAFSRRLSVLPSDYRRLHGAPDGARKDAS